MGEQLKIPMPGILSSVSASMVIDLSLLRFVSFEGLETLFMNLLVVSDTYIHEGVGNCLVVKNGGRYRVFLAHMEYLGETCWKRRHLEPKT